MLRLLPASSLPASNIGSSKNPKDIAKYTRKGFKNAHQLSGGEVCEKLGVDPRSGLTAAQVATRLEKYGYNLPPGIKDAASVAKWIACSSTQTYTVNRCDALVQVQGKRLVVGDIISLEAGQNIPADIRILRCDISVEKRPVFVPGTGFRFAEVEVATTLDTADIGGKEPLVVVSGVCGEKYVHEANNIAVRGCSVLSGKLIGVVIATGAGCRYSVPKQTVKLSNPFKYAKNIDRKKLLRLCDQLESLGMAVQSPDALPPFCNQKSMYIVLAISARHLPHLNTALCQLVGQGHKVVVHVGHDIVPKTDIAQISSASIGKPIALDAIQQLFSAQNAADVLARLRSESVVVTVGPEDGASALVQAIKETLAQPVIFYGDHIDNISSHAVADLGVCSYESSTSVRLAAKAVLGPRGLALLALHLKIVSEANDISTL